MRRLRYAVAASLDGYIADPRGGYDWIVMDPSIDFAAYAAKIDALVMGRGTYQVMQAAEGAGGGTEGEGRDRGDRADRGDRPAVNGGEGGEGDPFADMKTYVVSTTLDPVDHPDVTVVPRDVERFVADLKAQDGKDIWLFGGGVLFRALLGAGLVDRVEVGVMPVLLGDGIPLLAGGELQTRLELHSVEQFPSGVVLLKYDVGG